MARGNTTGAGDEGIAAGTVPALGRPLLGWGCLGGIGMLEDAGLLGPAEKELSPALGDPGEAEAILPVDCVERE